MTAIFLLPVVAIAAASHKPLPPLTVSITPAAASEIKPGDEVELVVTAWSVQEAPDLAIDVQLRGGAKLVSGSTHWKGSISRNEPRTLTLTVRTPEKGTGSVRARVSLPPSKGARFSAETEFILGPDSKTASEPKPSLQKDGKGGGIREYR